MKTIIKIWRALFGVQSAVDFMRGVDAAVEKIEVAGGDVQKDCIEIHTSMHKATRECRDRFAPMIRDTPSLRKKP